MKEIKFEWDTEKNRTNIRKHGVSFEEAEFVFNDRNGLIIYDEEHSMFENRFIILGRAGRKILVTVYCVRQDNIRIISARRATKRETEQYYERLI